MRVSPKTVYTLICLATFFLTACKTKPVITSTPAIIPLPKSQQINEGVFKLDETLGLSYDEALKPAADLLKAYIENGSGVKLDTETKNSKSISFKIDETIPND